MEIKTKHKKFETFTELYTFMVDSHLNSMKVTIKFPDGSSKTDTMTLDVVLSFMSVEQIATLDGDLFDLSQKHNVELAIVREIAELCNELHYFDDEEDELETALEHLEASDELKQEVSNLVAATLHAE